MSRKEEELARWRGLMDETIAEVFAVMLGCACVPAEGCGGESSSALSTSARVRYSGALAGECAVRFAAADAAGLAERLMGEAADDAMAADAVGELCNMVAGGWKRRLGPPASGAELSVPTLGWGAGEPSGAARRRYRFDGTQFDVDLAIDGAMEE